MTAPTVLVAGSLHHDLMIDVPHLPRRDETAVGTRWYPKFGGKGGNQAVACARHGVAVRMVGAVGDDGFGLYLRDGLRAGGVDQRFVVTVPGVGSGMSVAMVDAAGDYAATIVSGANLRISPDDLALPGLWDAVGLLVLQNEVPEAVNMAAAVQARARGLRVVLNAAPFRALSAEFAGLVDMLVVNAVEAEMMGAPPVADLAGAARAAEVLAKGLATVIVTAGDAGLALHGPDGAVRIAAEPVTVVSSHGAGDAFVGALAAGLMRGHPTEQAARAASIAAARHVAGVG